MKISISLFVLAMLLIGLVGFSTHSPPALAETDARLGGGVKIWDDGEIYTAVLARHFELPVQDLENWHLRVQNPDDLAVILFLAEKSGKSPEFVMILRKEGASWGEIGEGFGLDRDAWFVRAAETPPPPFDDLYERMENSKLARDRLFLSDADCRHLLAAKVLHEYFEVSAETAMAWRATGKDLEELTADEYRARHVQGRSKDDQSDRASLLMESSMFGPGLHPDWH